MLARLNKRASTSRLAASARCRATVNREADGQSDQNVADKDNDMLEVADDQGVVGRNEEEVDDKIGGEGGGSAAMPPTTAATTTGMR